MRILAKVVNLFSKIQNLNVNLSKNQLVNNLVEQKKTLQIMNFIGYTQTGWLG